MTISINNKANISLKITTLVRIIKRNIGKVEVNFDFANINNFFEVIYLNKSNIRQPLAVIITEIRCMSHIYRIII